MQELTDFIHTQRVLQIAPKAAQPWITNVFMGCEEPTRLYFIGSRHAHYGQQLLASGEAAFATAWYNQTDHTDRKGIQGVGSVQLASAPEDIETGVRLHNKNYPEFAKRITVDWVHTNDKGSGVWIISPQFIKFWSDEHYGEEESREFSF